MFYPEIPEIKRGMDRSAVELAKTGYRLPIDSEWEYACRAESVTVRAYGSDERLLGQYAWFLSNAQNRPWPVGLLKPNDFGMFDMYGNVWEWCQHPDALRTGRVFDDEAGPVDDPIARGGSFIYHAPFVRSAKLYGVPAWKHDWTVGFRVARTLPQRDDSFAKRPPTQ